MPKKSKTGEHRYLRLKWNKISPAASSQFTTPAPGARTVHCRKHAVVEIVVEIVVVVVVVVVAAAPPSSAVVEDDNEEEEAAASIDGGGGGGGG
jgi:hypothetical protein